MFMNPINLSHVETIIGSLMASYSHASPASCARAALRRAVPSTTTPMVYKAETRSCFARSSAQTQLKNRIAACKVPQHIESQLAKPITQFSTQLCLLIRWWGRSYLPTVGQEATNSNLPSTCRQRCRCLTVDNQQMKFSILRVQAGAAGALETIRMTKAMMMATYLDLENSQTKLSM